MSSQNNPPREININRTFDAPRDLVFSMWTDPTHVAAWWGPHGFTNPRVDIDLQPGGAYSIDMKGPDGQIYPDSTTVEDVVPNEKLVLMGRVFEDGQGGFHLEVRQTITFTEQDGKTLVSIHASVLKVSPEAFGALAGMEQGWSESLEKLAVYATAHFRSGGALRMTIA